MEMLEQVVEEHIRARPKGFPGALIALPPGQPQLLHHRGPIIRGRVRGDYYGAAEEVRWLADAAENRSRVRIRDSDLVDYDAVIAEVTFTDISITSSSRAGLCLARYEAEILS